MTITPLILGNGRSGQAIARSLTILNLLRPELDIRPPVWLTRGAALDEARGNHEHPVLCISNPHGLHAKTILDAERAGFDAILCEKPACVNAGELQALRQVKTPVAVLHVYRAMWGMQTLKEMLAEGRFGEVISIEGRYWQASAAERALQAGTPSPKGWKNDTALAGEYDTYLDLATHWIDAANFLLGAGPSRILGWRSHVNAETPHRDTHVQLSIDYPGTRAFGSVSKTYHGAGNHFEINVIGSKLSASWEFVKPDEILIGEGRDRRVVTRKDTRFGSQHPPFHGVGWIEGYIEIAARLFDEVYGKQERDYPNLSTSLDTLEAMFGVQWQ